jgi:hypothetical protein
MGTFRHFKLLLVKTIVIYRAVSVLLLLSLFTACEDPEPYYNKNAHPPTMGALVLEDIEEGQHITGTVTINFAPPIPASEILFVSLMVDNEMIYQFFSEPYLLYLDTKQWPEGEHTISIGILEKNPPDLGLLSLAGVPSKVYSIDVFFDHKPPTPVVLESIVWNSANNTPLVTWQKNTDANFYAYIVQWEVNGNYHDSGYILDQNITSYSNPEMNNGAIGFTGTWRVYVYNRDLSLASNVLTFSYPETFVTTVDLSVFPYKPILSKDGTELFVLKSEGLQAISLANYTAVRNYYITFPTSLALSSDGTKLYLISPYSPRLTVLDAATFEVIATHDPQDFAGVNIIEGRNDRIYLSTSWSNGNVKILDANTFEVLGNININAPNGLLAISPDHNTLYVAHPSNAIYESAHIYAVDVTTDNPVVIKQQTASDQVRGIAVSDDGQKLFVLHDFDYSPALTFVDCLNASTFESIRHLNVPNQAFSMSLVNEHLSVVYGPRNLVHWEPGGVMLFNADTGGEISDWKFVQAPFESLFNPKNQELYVFGFKTWIVPLNGH